MADSSLKVPYAVLHPQRARDGCDEAVNEREGEQQLQQQQQQEQQLYTPAEWSSKPELQNRTLKGKDLELRCPDGCRVFFRRASATKRCHFAHASDGQERQCLYLQKYAKSGGESEEHRTAKILIQYCQRFSVKCCSPGCERWAKSVRVDPTWKFETEARFSATTQRSFYLIDAVFREPTSERHTGTGTALAVEVLHTHETKDHKLRWLRQQPFPFVEVRARDVLRAFDRGSVSRREVEVEVVDSSITGHNNPLRNKCSRCVKLEVVSAFRCGLLARERRRHMFLNWLTTARLLRRSRLQQQVLAAFRYNPVIKRRVRSCALRSLSRARKEIEKKRLRLKQKVLAAFRYNMAIKRRVRSFALRRLTKARENIAKKKAAVDEAIAYLLSEVSKAITIKKVEAMAITKKRRRESKKRLDARKKQKREKEYIENYYYCYCDEQQGSQNPSEAISQQPEETDHTDLFAAEPEAKHLTHFVQLNCRASNWRRLVQPARAHIDRNGPHSRMLADFLGRTASLLGST